MPTRTCVFCGGRATGRGDHIESKAWLETYWDPQGPFTLDVNGQPVTVSGGVHQAQVRPRTMLPGVCNQDNAGADNCNGWLGRTVDEPGVPRLVTAIKDLRPLTTRAAVEDFARWWVKMLLLDRHPDAGQRYWKHPSGGYANIKPWEPWPVDMLPAWRSTGLLPPELSLWAAVYDPGRGTEQLSDAVRLCLPHTFRSARSDDGAGGCGQVSEQDIALPNETMLAVQLVYHPLIDFTHPFEAAGLAVRLWPQPPGQLDLKALPVLSMVGAEQWKSLFLLGHIAGVGVPTSHRLHLHPSGTDSSSLPCYNPGCGAL